MTINEPFKTNYDTYGPDSGWHQMHNFKSIQEFLKHKRKRRAKKIKKLQQRIDWLFKKAIDFQIDDQMNSFIETEHSNPAAGLLTLTLPEVDFENKDPSELNFGRNYDSEEIESTDVVNEESFTPNPAPLFGLSDTLSDEGDTMIDPMDAAQYGGTNSGNTIYNKVPY